VAGRPTKLTPELQERLCSAIRTGSYLAPACGHAGVDRRTLYRWLAAGRKARSGPLRDLYLAVRKAEADCEVGTVAKWRQAMPSHPQEYRHFLAKRYPERWSEKRRLELMGKRGGPVLSRRSVESMSDAELHALIDRLLGVPAGFAAGRFAGRGPAPLEVPEDDGRPENVEAPAGPEPAPAASSYQDVLVEDAGPPRFGGSEP
jgi:hypothetical protein